METILQMNNDVTLGIRKNCYVVSKGGKEWEFLKFEYACYFMISISTKE